MKKIGFLSVLLVFSLSLPMALGFAEAIGDNDFALSLCNEAQSEEKESEEKEGIDETEEYVLFDSSLPSFYVNRTIEATIACFSYKNINREILTPPPDFS